MIKKNKIVAFSGIFAVIAILIFYMIFSGGAVCKGISVEFDVDTVNYLIDTKDIKAIVLNEYKDLVGASIDIVDLAKLESKIEEHPSIRNADVFKKLNGILSVKIDNRIPIVRIMPITGVNFYIDKEGAMMPLSPMGSARVLVANGYINYKYKDSASYVQNDSTISQTLEDLYTISKYISEDAFLRAQIEQIYVKQNGEFELVPKVGKHIVLLGDVFEYKKKLKYLKHFYLNVMNKVGWRTYSYLNLKFKNQIVCTKTNS